MPLEPLDTSLAVRKLFTDAEIQRVRRCVEGRRRVRFVHPGPPPVAPVRWPEWIVAIAAVGALAVNLATRALSEYPRIRVALLFLLVLPGTFWVGSRIFQQFRIRRFQRELQLDQVDLLLTRAAAVVRSAELVKGLVEPAGQTPGLGNLETFLHGSTEQRLRAQLSEALAGATNVADMILCFRPPLDNDTLFKWGSVLRDRTMRIHRVVAEIAALARTVPGAPREEHLGLADAAYESYRSFWQTFRVGSGVSWDHSDPLLPDMQIVLPALRYPLPAK